MVALCHPRTQSCVYTASELVFLQHGTIRLVHPHTLLSMAGLRSCCLPPCAGSPASCLTWHDLMLLSSKPTLSLSSLLHLQPQQPSDGPASTSSYLLNRLHLSFLDPAAPQAHASSYLSSLSSPMRVPYPQPTLPSQQRLSLDLTCLSSCASSSLIVRLVGEPFTSCLHPLPTPLWSSTGHSVEEQQAPRPLDEVGEMRLRSS